MKVAIGSALPCTPGALHHNNPIADGYARVTVEDIVQGCEDLEIDYPTPEGDVKLRDVKRQFVLWKKKYIKFPGEAPRPTSPPPSGGGGGGGSPPSGGGGGGGSPTPPSRQPPPPPNPPPAGKQTPPPSPPPAGTPPPSPPPAGTPPPVHLRRRSRSRGLRGTTRQPPRGLLTRSLMYLRPQGYQCHH